MNLRAAVLTGSIASGVVGGFIGATLVTAPFGTTVLDMFVVSIMLVALLFLVLWRIEE